MSTVILVLWRRLLLWRPPHSNIGRINVGGRNGRRSSGLAVFMDRVRVRLPPARAAAAATSELRHRRSSMHCVSVCASGNLLALPEGAKAAALMTIALALMSSSIMVVVPNVLRTEVLASLLLRATRALRPSVGVSRRTLAAAAVPLAATRCPRIR